MLNGSKLGLESNYTHDPKTGTSTVGNKVCKHRGNTTGNMAHCEVPRKQVWTKGTNYHSWSFRLKVLAGR
jgi:hypothetical protein